MDVKAEISGKTCRSLC